MIKYLFLLLVFSTFYSQTSLSGYTVVEAVRDNLNVVLPIYHKKIFNKSTSDLHKCYLIGEMKSNAKINRTEANIMELRRELDDVYYNWAFQAVNATNNVWVDFEDICANEVFDSDNLHNTFLKLVRGNYLIYKIIKTQNYLYKSSIELLEMRETTVDQLSDSEKENLQLSDFNGFESIAITDIPLTFLNKEQDEYIRCELTNLNEINELSDYTIKQIAESVNSERRRKGIRLIEINLPELPLCTESWFNQLPISTNQPK